MGWHFVTRSQWPHGHKVSVPTTRYSMGCVQPCPWQWTQWSRLVTTDTAGHSGHNGYGWSQWTRLVTVVTAGHNGHGWSQWSQWTRLVIETVSLEGTFCDTVQIPSSVGDMELI